MSVFAFSLNYRHVLTPEMAPTGGLKGSRSARPHDQYLEDSSNVNSSERNDDLDAPEIIEPV